MSCKPFPTVRAFAIRAKALGTISGIILCAASCGGLDDPQPPAGGDSTTSTTDGNASLKMVPAIAANGDLRVSATPDSAATVAVRSQKFATLADLYRFATETMGGQPVRDAAGEIVGVHGVSITSGDITYRDEDTGVSFKARDLAQAFLGGAAGKIQVAGEVLAIKDLAPSADGEFKIASALTGDSQACVGDDCITGSSWKSDYIVYHSVGSESQQSSGGYGSVSYACCTAGTPVTYQGQLQCRVVTEWEPADPENGIYRPIPVAYGYRPRQTCSYTTTVNTLSLTVTAILPSGFVGSSTSRSEVNSRDVTLSNWAVGVGVSFLGIDDVAGVCGLHSGSRGGTSRTRAGNATDARCGAIPPVFLTATASAAPATTAALE